MLVRSNKHGERYPYTFWINLNIESQFLRKLVFIPEHVSVIAIAYKRASKLTM